MSAKKSRVAPKAPGPVPLKEIRDDSPESPAPTQIDPPSQAATAIEPPSSQAPSAAPTVIEVESSDGDGEQDKDDKDKDLPDSVTLIRTGRI